MEIMDAYFWRLPFIVIEQVYIECIIFMLKLNMIALSHRIRASRSLLCHPIKKFV